MKKIFFLIVFVYFAQTIFGQNIAPFKEGKLWGLKNTDKKVVVVPAKFLKCSQLVDNYFFVMSIVNNERLNAVINEKGDTIINFGYNLISAKPCESELNYCFYEHSNAVYVGTSSKYIKGNHIYLIDKERNCIATDYHPCPVWKKAIDTIPEYLRYIQVGEKFCDNNQLESAIVACFSAINEAPSNPYPYYWGANILLRTNFHENSYIPDKLLSKYDALAAEWLEKADSLENRPDYKLLINTLGYNFYRFHKKDRKKSREILSQAKQYGPVINKTGLCLITGFEYSFNPYVELGIGTGNFSFKPKSIFYNGQGFILFGGSYLKSLTNRTDAMNLYFYSILRPIRLGLCLFNYTDYQEISLVLRPEIGFSFKNFTVSYGYNFYSKKSFLRDQNHNTFSIRYFIPFKNKIEFDKH